MFESIFDSIPRKVNFKLYFTIERMDYNEK